MAASLSHSLQSLNFHSLPPTPKHLPERNKYELGKRLYETLCTPSFTVAEASSLLEKVSHLKQECLANIRLRALDLAPDSLTVKTRRSSTFKDTLNLEECKPQVRSLVYCV
jgi:hypothetical protein